MIIRKGAYTIGKDRTGVLDGDDGRPGDLPRFAGSKHTMSSASPKTPVT